MHVFIMYNSVLMYKHSPMLLAFKLQTAVVTVWLATSAAAHFCIRYYILVTDRWKFRSGLLVLLPGHVSTILSLFPQGQSQSGGGPGGGKKDDKVRMTDRYV